MDAEQIRLVRRFNRAVTQRVGALEDGYLSLGRPLGQARVLFETGPDGVDVAVLRARLGLDSGYLSRLLRSLEAQGLIALDRQPGDGRQRRAHLTPAGMAEFSKYEALSDQLAASMLAPLDAGRRDRMVRAMGEVERLLLVSEADLRVEDPSGDDARMCLEAYFRELADRFDTGFDPARSNPARAEEMIPPSGWFVVARLEGRPVGCGALKRLSDKTGEIKRMWTANAARGRGVARQVLRRLEAIAREAGLTTLRLETNRTLTEAQKLYRREGYAEVAAFNDEPYAHHWFEKRL